MRDPALRQSKILIIDDEPDVVATLRQVLEEDGYREFKSTTNPAAVALLFAEFQPDLVVLDLVMPGMSGLQVLSQLRAMIPRETYLPILVVTGDTAKETRHEALARGASDFVAKPYDITEILARVGHMLETRLLHLQPLLESKRFLQSTLDALSSHIAILDEHGTIIAVNEAWNRFARENGDVGNVRGVGDNYLQLCDAATGRFSENASALARGIREVMAAYNDEFLLEYPYYNHPEPRWFLVRVTRFGSDGPVRVVVAYENVTERKLAEESLRASEANLAAAQRVAHIGSWELELADPDGGVSPLSWSDEMFRITGYASGGIEVTHEAFIDLIPAEEHGPLQQAMTTAIQTHEEYSFVHRLIRPDGEERIVRETGRIFLDETTGKPRKMVGTTQDITEQQRAEESIRVQAHMLDNVGQSVIALDLSGRITYANRFACELYGWLPAEMLGRGILEVIAPQSSPELAREIMAHFQRGGGWSGEFHVQSREGREFLIDVTDSPLLDHRGQLIGTIGISTDITESKQAEAALREAEEKYRSIFDNAVDGIFQNTPEGTLLSANSALARMLGFDSPEELIRERADLERQGYADPAQRREFRRLLEEKGFVTNFEYEVKRKDGSLICVSENVRVVRDAAGKALYYEGSVQDITVRKQTEEALFRSRETLRGILDNIPQRVFWKDYHSVYLGCNRACASDLGFSDPAEVIGKTDFELRWKAMADRYRADDRSVMDQDTPKFGFDVPAAAPDGRPMWDRTSKVPLHDQQGRVTGVLGTYEDVTAHKLVKLEIERLNADLEQRVAQRTNALFEATREAERANAAKSEFLSRTSHELRTPLNAILGFAQLLEMDENLGPEPRESIREILRSGRHLLTLVNEVLNVSSAETGHMPFSIEPVAVSPLIEETLCLVRPLGATFGVELDLAIPQMGNQHVLADRGRLKDALLNLLSNAIKYNHPGGKVVVRHVRAGEGTSPVLRLLVRDTGPGISAENLPRLFVPFDRLDVERTRAHVAGVGLGLALSKRTIELIGGRMGVESTLGRGSVFWIEVPLAKDPVSQTEQHALTPLTPPESKCPNTKTFLYIDHNASNVRLIARILARRPSIRLLTAATGRLGLECADEHCPDFILLDPDLPDGSSDKMLERLRDNPRTVDIPVAIISADMPPEKRERMITAGVRAFLTKPLEIRALLRLLDQSTGLHPVDKVSK